MFLDEYLDSELATSVDKSPGPVDHTALFDRWRRTCGRGNDTRFTNRLSALGMDPVSAVDALQPRRFEVLPSWAEAANEIGDTAPGLRRACDGDDDAVVPFASLYAPWTRFGLTRLEQRVRIPDPLRRPLVTMLRSRLRWCGEPVILDEFKRSGMGYEQWIDHQLRHSFVPLFDALPVWARLVTTVTLDWVDGLGEFLRALERDREIVCGLVGEDDFTPSWVHQAGDPHRQGRQVIVLTTDLDGKVVYKPRSLAAEALARSVSDHLRACGAIDIDLVGPVVDCGDHGWMGWIETQLPSPEQMPQYSYNAGLALAFAHRLAIADLHFENVLPVGDRAVLVDLECLGNSRPNLVSRPAGDGGGDEILDRSVMTTCMLVSVGNYERDGRDDSGLTGILEAADSEVSASYEWQHLATDDIDLVRTRIRSRCDDQPVMVDVDQVIAGLDFGEAAIDEHGLGVNLDTDIHVRVIAQNTARYAELLQRAVTRASLSNGLQFSIELDAVSRPGTAEEASSWRLDACDVERRHMQRLDIPLFTVPLNSTTGSIGSHEIPDLVDQTGVETINARHRDAGPEFRRLQRQITQLLLDQRLALVGRKPAPEPSAVTSCAADALAVCEALAAELEASALPDDDGGLTWLDIEQPARFVMPVMADGGLMSGNAGVGLFLAGLATLSQGERWAALARATLAGEPPLDEPVLSYGISGRGYALLIAGVLLDDQALVRRGQKLLERVPMPDALSHVDKTDFLAGFPGVAAALAAAATITGDCGLAERAGAYIDASRSEWRAAASSPDLRKRIAVCRIGVAHGITGIELAVARVIEARRATGLADDPGHEAWLGELVASENERIERRSGVPGRLDPVTREPDVGWCWGVSGFVTARRAIARLTGLAAAEHGIARGEEIAAARLAPADRACCGKPSQVLALGAAQRKFVVERLLELRGRWMFEAESPFQAVSLLRGSAGLGLALLEHVHPGMVPNPFIVEPI